MKALQSIKGVLDNHGRLLTRIMIEEFVSHDFSPSTTFFLGEEDVIPLTVNYQFLNQGKFFASTNILPEGTETYAFELQQNGLILARRAQVMGARDFLGIDWVGQKAVEANYRETGATIPEVIAQRANNFIDGIGWANWLFIMSIPYSKQIPHFEAALDILRENEMLFEGKSDPRDANTPRVVPLYGLQPDDFDMVVFWRKESIPLNESFAIVNDTLKLLGSTKRVSVPR